ncbi:MAG: protein translocase subunit SecD [Pseudomonadota bacterium]|nr:protein translocase subunit SecD [Pseudomonadota bacterium]
MNRYPWWKNLLVAAALLVGLLYALPNFFGLAPALQISPENRAASEEDLRRVTLGFGVVGVKAQSVDLPDGQVVARFADVSEQLAARSQVQAVLGRDYLVALNLVPSAPDWLKALGAEPMFLGLDLRGGVHFLMEVDMNAAVAAAGERYEEDMRVLLREQNIRYLSSTRVVGDADRSGVLIKFREAPARDEAVKVIRSDHPELEIEELSRDGAPALELLFSDDFLRETRDWAVQQNITTLRNRVNELGVAEPIIQRQGESRIIVQLPGIQDPTRAKEVLGATATLEFKLVNEEADPAAVLDGRPVPGSRVYPMRDGGRILLKKRTILTGESITDASSGIDSQTGGPVVHVSLDGRGAKLFEQVTGENIGRRLAVIFIENKMAEILGDNGEVRRVAQVSEEVITAPVIQDRLGRRFQITGLDSPQEARDLALLLRAGSLAAPVTIVEERTVGPSLGQDNIRQGVYAVIIGLLLVAVFTVFWYRGFGAVAVLALGFNLLLLVALLSLLQATLTLPGIAGIVLTVGMAIDANVLIFERIREEIANGNSPQASIRAGYEKAFGTILDANVTTLIAAVVLFIFGTGPIRGFAVTLSLGLITSMFTAIMVTRAIVNLLYGNRRLSRLAI